MQEYKLEISIAKYLLRAESALSLELQGLILRLRMLMATSERLGYLQLNGENYPPRMLAAKVGCSEEHLLPLLSELAQAKVFPETTAGIMYDPDMVARGREREHGARRQRSFRDRQSALHNAGSNGAVTDGVTDPRNGGPSLSSLSEGVEDQKGKKKRERDAALRNGESNAPLRNDFEAGVRAFIKEPEWGVGKAAGRAQKNVDSLIDKFGVERTVALFAEAHERTPTPSLAKLALVVLDALARVKPAAKSNIPTKDRYAQLERNGF